MKLTPDLPVNLAIYELFPSMYMYKSLAFVEHFKIGTLKNMDVQLLKGKGLSAI